MLAENSAFPSGHIDIVASKLSFGSISDMIFSYPVFCIIPYQKKITSEFKIKQNSAL